MYTYSPLPVFDILFFNIVERALEIFRQTCASLPTVRQGITSSAGDVILT